MTDSAQQPRKPNAIIAAARPVPLDDAKATKSVVGKRQSWQEEAWAYFDEVPEVKFGCLYLGNGMSKVRFYAAVELEDGTKVPIGHTSSPFAGTTIAVQADAEMERLRSPLGGQSELNKQAAINWSVAGEFYIHGIEARPASGVPGTPDFKPAEPERWEVRSVSEVEVTSETDQQQRPVVRIKSDEDDKGRAVDPDSETLIRMWIRHARWSNKADCHMRALLGDCEALVLFSNQQKAEAKSRQAAGVLLVPSELSFTDDENDSGEEQEQGQNKFIQALLKALTEPIEDPTSSASVMPLVLSGPAEFLTPDRLRLLSFGRTADSTLDERIEKRINRVARGLNVPVEVVMGHMSTTFANAEQIDEDVFTDHFQPLCEALADAYATGFLRPQLAASEERYDPADIERVHVWYDASELVRGPSVEESADSLYDRGVLSDLAYLRLKGGTPEDMPDERERLKQLAFTKGIFTAELTTLLLKKAGVLTDDDVTVSGGEVEERNVEPTPPSDEELAALIAAASAPRSLGQRLADIDRELRTKLHAAAEAAMARALERAGNRLKGRSSALSATLRHVPAYRAVATAGPALLASSGVTEDDLLVGAWDEYEAQFKEWSLAAVEATLDLLDEVLGPDSARRESLRSRYALQINDAWVWLAAALTEEAKRILYAPERGIVAAAGDDGEHDATVRVQVGVIREGMARAGGETGLTGERGVVATTNKRPPGGIATGAAALDELAAGGVLTQAFRWVYGPASRATFQPHRKLDGVVFENFDDPVLANNRSWPKTPFFYPGDHKGCVCDFEPVLIEAPAAAPGRGSGAKAATRERKAPKPTGPRVFATAKEAEEWADAALDTGLLTPKHIEALNRYTGRDYLPLNQLLRGQANLPDYAVAELNELRDTLDRALARTVLQEDVVTYRGISTSAGTRDLVDALTFGNAEGMEIEDPAFMSTTLNPEFHAGGQMRLVLTVPKGTHAAALKNVSQVATGENELLLARNTKYVIERVEAHTYDNPSSVSPVITHTIYARVVQ